MSNNIFKYNISEDRLIDRRCVPKFIGDINV